MQRVRVMDIDHLKSAQGNQLEMLMTTLPNTEEKLLPDYFAGGHRSDGQVGGFPNYYPENHHLASPSFSSLPSNNSKIPIISFTTGGSSYKTDGPELDGSKYCSGTNGNMAAMREMIFRIAAMQPINIDPEAVKPLKRRNVRISSDPQSMAARHRRERISERIRILQRLVPGGTKMDTASMLDEAIHYVKFLKRQVQSLERTAYANNDGHGEVALRLGFPVSMAGHRDQAGYSDNNNNPTSHNYYLNPQVPAPARTEQGYGDF